MTPATPPGPGRPDDDVPAAEREALRRGAWRPWLPFLVTAAVCIGMLGWVMVALPDLPDRVPVHWGIDGRPDDWDEKSLGTVGMGPIVALGMTVLMALMAAIVPMMSPLPPDASPWRRVRQAGVDRGMRTALGWIAALTLLPMLPSTVEVLTAGAWRMPWWLMPLSLTLLMVGVMVALSAAIRGGTRWSDRVAQDLGHRPTAEEAAEEEKWTAAGLKRDPDDPSAFPPKREGYGVGATVNLASRTGRLLTYGFVGVFIVGLPAAVWIAAALNR